MKIAITLLTCNYAVWTRQCLRTLKKFTPESLFDCVIVDNGSTDGTRDILSEYNYHSVLLADNIGVARARNIAITTALNKYNPDYICFIHNDMLFSKNWLEKSIDAITSLPKLTILGISNILGEQYLFLDDDERQVIADSALDDKVAFANLEPRFYPSSVFSDIGLLDEQYEQSEAEDVDFNIRISRSNYQILATNKATCFHALGLVRLRLLDNQKIRASNLNKCVNIYGRDVFNKYNFACRSLFYVNGIPHLRLGV